MKNLLLYVLCSCFLLSGCAVRTYKLTRDRVDQDLSVGNRGFLMGSGMGYEAKERKPTRTTHVVEVELGSPIKLEKRSAPKPVSSDILPSSPEVKSQIEPIAPAKYAESETLTPEQNLQKYTVQKNETLQKISRKLYGTTKKWKKIYELNKEVLKGPDKIYPGQVLNVPAFEESKHEPFENLK